MNLSTRLFSTIELDDQGEAYVTRTVPFQQEQDSITIFIVDGFPSAPNMMTIGEQLLDHVERFNHQAKHHLRTYQKDDLVKDFVSFHIEELPQEAQDALNLEALHDPEAFIDAMTLVGICLHDKGEGVMALSLDYSIGRLYTDELLVVRFDQDKRFIEITHES